MSATPHADLIGRAGARGAIHAPGTRDVSGPEARSRRLAAAVVVAAVLAGGALGVAADRFVLASRPTPAPHGLDAFAAELGLSRAQRNAVDSIMDARRRAIETAVAPVRPQLDSIRAAGRRDIRQRLNAAQQARYDAYVARLEQQERADAARRR